MEFSRGLHPIGKPRNMKHLWVIVLAAFGCHPSSPMFTPNLVPATPITFQLTHEYWEGCETGLGPCEPPTFVRTNRQESFRLIMPCGGTTTSVYLYQQNPGIAEVTPVDSLNIDASQCPPSFDLSYLPDGDYVAYMLACGLGGPAPFRLETHP
ncbi:MAG TPA: hypothetical protein DCR93_39305 [Cytophagales bacterium]|nr:hypothetical protein [Cytophagales bacterium]HAP65277.1 hypothetical protein [Cytophagales bacterium]